MKASQIFCKQLESADRTPCGYILGISRRDCAIEGYICCDERENEFFVGVKSIKFYAGKATFQSADFKKKSKNSARLKLGCPLYSEDGKFLGLIDDFTIMGNSIAYAHVKNRKYPFGRIALGDVAILKSEKPLAEIAAKDLFINAILDEGRA